MMLAPTARIVVFGLLLSLVGCAGLPDQQAGMEALNKGDQATAEWNFRGLAERGYPDAQIALGDLLLAKKDPKLDAEAESWYRKAASQSLKAKSRLGKLLARNEDAPSERLLEAERLLREALLAQEVSALVPLLNLYMERPELWPQAKPQALIEQGRALGFPEADVAQLQLYRQQGVYAQHLDEVQQVCQKWLGQQENCYPELTELYQRRQQSEPLKTLLSKLQQDYARQQVRPTTLYKVAIELLDPELGKVDPKAAQTLLLKIAPDLDKAWIRLAKLQMANSFLGDTAQLLGYLEKAKAAGFLEADLLLGRLYYEGKWVAADPVAAEQHLLAAASQFPAADYMLGQIYRRGLLGHADPRKALHHLLIAARAGQTSADYALAEMFSESKGVKPDPVAAYVFAQSALLGGIANSASVFAILRQVMSEMPPEQLQAARTVLRAEIETRQTAQSMVSGVASTNSSQDAL